MSPVFYVLFVVYFQNASKEDQAIEPGGGFLKGDMSLSGIMDSVGSFENVDLSGIMEIIQDNIETVKSVSISCHGGSKGVMSSPKFLSRLGFCFLAKVLVKTK